ncbi:hypothetical protein E2562_005961 [Oryza meyeriana var. granulata]|uniref:Uncharacterized protein n=1 Tax=Oryza meyeriana var. granulata TaxID=110450 RepID=A0A6G1DVB8_9ORYZ|nr:hypothetical protein E2562_005961 [Oryza meyeriana var. granulata]
MQRWRAGRHRRAPRRHPGVPSRADAGAGARARAAVIASIAAGTTEVLLATGVPPADLRQAAGCAPS